VSPTAEDWATLRIRQDVGSLLLVVGAQVAFRERGKVGLVHGEVALPLGADGTARIKPWGLDDTLYALRASEVRSIVVARCTREQFVGASALNRQLAATGRFDAEAAPCPA
jgi:hypothetical protein